MHFHYMKSIMFIKKIVVPTSDAHPVNQLFGASGRFSHSGSHLLSGYGGRGSFPPSSPLQISNLGITNAAQSNFWKKFQFLRRLTMLWKLF